MDEGIIDAGRVILVASYPRSGNTLFRQVLEQCYGMPTYTVYKNEDTIGLWDDRIWPTDAPSDQPFYFLKSHFFTRHCGPMIYIARDGRDAYISQREYEHSERSLMAYMASGAWSVHVRWYLEQAPVLVRFEQLIRDPFGVVTNALHQLGLCVEGDAAGHLTPFDELHKLNPKFWRSGKVGEWREVLNEQEREAFWHTNGHMMESLRYERD